MSEMLFVIAGPAGTDYVLAVDRNHPKPGGQLVINDLDRKDPYQHWIMVYTQPTGSLVMYNPRLDLYAGPSAVEKGAPVVLYEMPNSKEGTAFSAGNTWNIEGQAFRVQQNTALNLNVSEGGSSPGTPVIIWTWDNPPGNNELWNLVPLVD